VELIGHFWMLSIETSSNFFEMRLNVRDKLDKLDNPYNTETKDSTSPYSQNVGHRLPYFLHRLWQSATHIEGQC